MSLQKTVPTAIICLFTLILVVCCATSAPSTAAPLEETFTLTVTIKSPHIDYFEFCIPVRVEEPFQVVWGNEKVKDSFSGVLHEAKDGAYPITINISEGGGSCREMTEPKLTLDKADQWANIVSLAFQHIDSRTLVLSKTRCQQPKQP